MKAPRLQKISLKRPLQHTIQYFLKGSNGGQAYFRHLSHQRDNLHDRYRHSFCRIQESDWRNQKKLRYKGPSLHFLL